MDKRRKALVATAIGWFRKHDSMTVNVIAIIGAGLAIWGFGIAYKNEGVDYNILNSAYSTLRLFAFDLDAPNLQGELVWQLEASRWMIVLFMLYYVAKGVILLLSTKYKLFRLKMSNGGHVIICGAGEKGKTLGLDWLKKDPDAKLFYVEPDINNVNIETLEEAGAVVVHGKAQEKLILKKLQVHKASHFITTTDHDTTNMEIISTLSDPKNGFLNDRNPKEQQKWWVNPFHRFLSRGTEEKLKCYVHLFHSEFYDFFMAKRFNEDGMELDIKIFNIYNNSARMLFINNKDGVDGKARILGDNVFTDKATIIEPTKKVKLAIFGFGKLGENVLLHALHLGHFYNGNPIEVTVVYDMHRNENANILDEFEKQYDILNKTYNGTYWKVKFIDDGKFSDENIEEYSQLIIAYENEFESLSNLMKLLKRYNDKILDKNIDVSIYSNSFASTAAIIKKDKPTEDENTIFEKVRTFGELNKTCSYDMVVDQVLDVMAEKNHKHYEKLHKLREKGYGKDWHDLSMFIKDSNRYLIEHMPIKKSVIKILMESKSGPVNDYEDIKETIKSKYFHVSQIINWDEMDVKPIEYATYMLEKEIIKLTKVEHKRWNAFHILNGWKVKSLDQLLVDTKGLSGHEAKDGCQKNKIKKTHACLVDWDELNKVSEIMEHDYKSDDIETIMRIPSLEAQCDVTKEKK